MDDSLDPRRKRILFRSRHMGMRETDILLGDFTVATVETLDESQLDAFEVLLDADDADLLKWILEREEAPAHIPSGILKLVIDFNKRNHTIEKLR